MSYVKYETINKTQRLAIHHFQDLGDPLEYTGIEGFAYARPNCPRTFEGIPRTQLFYTLKELYDRGYPIRDAIDLANRWARIFCPGDTLVMFEYRGAYSPSDWTDYVLSVPNDEMEFLEHELELFEYWLNGDTYLVALEELVKCTSDRGEEWFEFRESLDIDGSQLYIGDTYGVGWRTWVRNFFNIEITD